jgi:hypothetical protein
VIVGSPLLDTLEVYAGLGVAEVWIWRDADRRINVHRLDGDHYVRRARSEFLPDVDLELLGSYVRPGQNHTALAKAYRAALGRH